MFLDMIWLELIFQESNVFYCIEKFENLILGLEDGLQQFIVCFTDSLLHPPCLSPMRQVLKELDIAYDRMNSS